MGGWCRKEPRGEVRQRPRSERRGELVRRFGPKRPSARVVEADPREPRRFVGMGSVQVLERRVAEDLPELFSREGSDRCLQVEQGVVQDEISVRGNVFEAWGIVEDGVVDDPHRLRQVGVRRGE